MTLTAGSRLGPYEILAPLGAGGMGEVYKARDTRLERTVAIKVLPSGLASSTEQRRRFEREARTISKLSHPHICALHDVGREGETEYLVMEYLEGETLSDRLAKGALPLEQTLRYGAQIADALDKAHRQGIVHRDLKPGNVMLTKSGVKLLDFGLAKVMAPETAISDLTSNPTAAARSDLTEEGTLLGTLPYMAPEQLEGKEADGRTDIFALGATLYEMATGRKAFSGSSRASLISSILRDEPKPVSQIEAMSPPALDRIIGRCLAKDPEQRWQSAADVGLELAWIARGGADEKTASVSRLFSSPRWWIGLAIAGLLAAAVATFYAVRRPVVVPARPIRFTVRAPQGSRFAWIRMSNLFAVSPDGQRIAMAARSADGHDSLWVRAIADASATPLPGTEGAASPFWSPDSLAVAFFADGKLKKIDLSGGPAVTICDAPAAARFPSGSWGSGHSILFAGLTSPVIEVVGDGGGLAKAAVKIDASRAEVAVSWPSFLPDGRHFLYVGRSSSEKQTYVRMGSLDGDTVPLVANCSRAEFAPGGPNDPAGSRSGYVLFAREGNLLAQPFDSKRLRLAEDPIPAGQEIWQHVLVGTGPFSASNNGVLASRGNPGPARLVWLDRTGRETGSLEAPAQFDSVRLSPDSRRVVVTRVNPRTGTHDLWVGDLLRQVLTRLDLGPNDYLPAFWSPDGARIAFSIGSMRHPPALHQLSLRGSGSPEPIIPSGGIQRLEDWSPDGRFLVFESLNESGAGHWMVDLEGDRKPRLLVPGNIDEPQAQFSPDGRWFAYCVVESGRSEVYLSSFPEPGERIRVSASGGARPHWKRDGRELYLLSDNQMIAIPVRLGSDVQLGPPQLLFRMDPAGWRDYDVTPDGQRFLAVVNLPAEDADSIAVTVNWTSVLKR